MQIVIDRFGRMVLPKAIRDNLGLHPGDVLDAQEERGAIVLQPTGRTDALQGKGKALVYCGISDGDITAAIKRHRSERIRKMSGGLGRL